MSNTPIQGRRPTTEEEALTEGVKDSLKNTPTKLNAVLTLLITINLALLAVSMLFDINILSKNEKIIVILCFLFSMLVALIGFIPFEGKVQMDIPESSREHFKKAVAYKKGFIIASVTIFLIGLLILIVNYLQQLTK